MTPPPPNNKNRKPGLTAKGDQRQYVKHSYKDRSTETIGELTTSDENTLRLYQEDSVGGPFPLKLQIVLKVTEKLGQQHIISWLPHGRSFMIHRPREFETEIMGKFFKQTKLTSFRRQLNLYDFQRITHGRDAGSYYHELFLRGRPLLAKRMIRRKVKGTKIRASSSPDDEPNFYNMPAMETLSDIPAGAGGMGMIGHQDPSLNGHGALGSSIGGGANLSSFTGAIPGQSPNGMMNPQDPAAAAQFNHQGLLQQQQQAALASLQNPGAFSQQYGQNNLYSDLMNMNRMGFGSHLYGPAGGMNNFDYLSALQQRNALASSAFGFNGGYNPYLQGNDASLLGGLQAAGFDPRLSPYNKQSLLGAQGGIGDLNAAPYSAYPGQATGDLNIPQTMNPAPTGAHGVVPPQAGAGVPPSSILMEQMNLANQETANESAPNHDAAAKPNEDKKQNAVEQLLSLGKDQSNAISTMHTDTKVKEEKKDDSKVDISEIEKPKDEPKPVVKDGLKTEVLAL